MRTKVLLASLIVLAALLVGCAQTTPPATTDSNTDTSTDVVSTASVVGDAVAFQNAISKDGTWIIATTKDLTINNDLVLDGVFLNGKKDADGNDITQRKIGLYTQDADRNITARFILTAPKLTINSPMASIEYGTFKGDVYVSANNFKLVDAKIDGNLYFTTEEAQATFTMDATSSVTGVQELKI